MKLHLIPTFLFLVSVSACGGADNRATQKQSLKASCAKQAASLCPGKTGKQLTSCMVEAHEAGKTTGTCKENIDEALAARGNEQ